MMTVHEVSGLTGVSIRTLRYYDGIGLLIPAAVTDAGYRLYDEENLARLHEILMFRELQFPLKDIKEILNDPSYDRTAALDKQIGLLTLKKEHIEKLISHARQIREGGKEKMSFRIFDKSYAEEARKAWGDTDAYREFEKKTADYSGEKHQALGNDLMDLFRRFGAIRSGAPEGEEAQKPVRELRDFITANYYTCTPQILKGLGQMYAAGGEMTDNIDAAGGEGTAVFAARAIESYRA